MGLIDKEKLKQDLDFKSFNEEYNMSGGLWVSYRLVEEVIDAQPEQPERRKGRWINDVAYYDEEGCPYIVTRCDQCGEPGFGRYCPYCGADMREENDG